MNGLSVPQLLSGEIARNTFARDFDLIGAAMAIPTQTEMFRFVLQLMSDGKVRARAQVKKDAAAMLGLSDEERKQLTAGGQYIYVSRIDWAISYLDRANLLDRVSRGVYRINANGSEFLLTAGQGSEFYRELVKRIQCVNPWRKSVAAGKAKSHSSGEPDGAPDEKSPQEAIGDMVSELNDALIDELIQLILNKEPDFFEKVVVDLLAAMGYGKGKVTSYSHDGGIDGLVTTDELGFKPIYTQAKRYAEDKSVGRPMIQSFVGALNGARNGVFITTSSFTHDALVYAKNYPNATISLIDGHKLARLMIKYNLGVATEEVVEIKRIDGDYFEMV